MTQRIPVTLTPKVVADVPVDLFDNVARVGNSLSPQDVYDVTVRINGDILRSMLVQPLQVDGIRLQPVGRELSLVLQAASVEVRAGEAGVATLPAAATSIALFAAALSALERSWLDALVFLALAGMAAAWTYLDTATEGRRT